MTTSEKLILVAVVVGGWIYLRRTRGPQITAPAFYPTLIPTGGTPIPVMAQPGAIPDVTRPDNSPQSIADALGRANAAGTIKTVSFRNLRKFGR